MFSFNNGRAVAKIKGGKYDGKIIHIDNGENEEPTTKSKKGKKEKNDILGTDFEIDDGKLEIIPNLEQRETLYIAGPSGSGKSTFAAKYIQKYQKIFHNPVYVFSRDNGGDKEINALNPIYIPITEDLLANPIDITEEMQDALILFDDCNTIQDDKVRKSVEKLINDILEVGRKLNIYIVVTSHLVIPNERKQARTIMNEMQVLTVFPKSGSSQQISYCLKTYFGLNKDQIEEILSLPSRQVTIYKTFPMFVVYDTGIYIL